MTITLKTLLDNKNSISSPETGPSGESENVSFTKGEQGKGARMIVRETFIFYPASVIDLESGSLEFYYKPVHDSNVNLRKHLPLFAVGVDGENLPHMSLILNNKVLEFAVYSKNGNEEVSTTSEKLWSSNDWVKIKVFWNRNELDRSLKIFINDVRKDVNVIKSGDKWDLSNMPQDAKLFVGCLNDLDNELAEGTIDSLVVESLSNELETESTKADLFVDLEHPRQTISGWGATVGTTAWGCDDYSQWRTDAMNLAVDKLGLTRFRLEAKSGIQSGIDYDKKFLDGEITLEEYKGKWYDPEENAPIQWTSIDEQMKDIVSLVDKVKARGRTPYVELTFVDFNQHTGWNHRHNPVAYADFVVKIFKYLEVTYNIVPDALEIILEHDLAGWTWQEIDAVIAETRPALSRSGYNPDIMAPSSTSMLSAIDTYDELFNKPDVLTYHRYKDVSAETLQRIGGVSRTAMLEWIGATIDELWDDLTIAEVEGWQQFTFAWCSQNDDGSSYIEGKPSPELRSRSKKLKQIFNFVDPGAKRYVVKDSTLSNKKTLGFVNPDGTYVYIVKSDSTETFSVGAGEWNISGIDSSGNEISLSVDNGMISIPAGIVSIYGKPTEGSVIVDDGNTSNDTTDDGNTSTDDSGASDGTTDTNPSTDEEVSQQQKIKIGTNIAQISYFTTDRPFINHMKYAGTSQPTDPWVSRTSGGYGWGDGGALDLDENGYVKSLNNQWITTLIPTHEGGRFIFLFDGQGTIYLSGENNPVSIVSQEPNRWVFDASPDDRLYLDITDVVVGDHIRNIRIVKEEYELTQDVFYPLWLERLFNFGIYRFMDWANTNNSNISTWSQRQKTEVASYSFGEAGIPYEVMVDVCNRQNADMWICVPHLADDDYVINLATLIRDKLNIGLKCYVEFSNEVWNTMFSQAQYAIQKGIELSLGDDQWHGAVLWQTERSLEIFDIFENVFGGLERLVRVLGGQQGFALRHRQMLSHKNAYQKVDAMAITTYFGNSVGHERNLDAILNEGKEFVLREAQNALTNELIPFLNDSKTAVDEFNVRLISYESNHHLLPSPVIHQDNNVVQAFADAIRDPRMYDLITQMLDAWKNVGGNELVNYSFVSQDGKWDMFGLLEKLEEITPSWNAYMDWMAKNL